MEKGRHPKPYPQGKDFLLEQGYQGEKIDEDSQVRGSDDATVKVGLPQSHREIEKKETKDQKESPSIPRK